MASQCFNSYSGRNRLSSHSANRCWQECVSLFLLSIMQDSCHEITNNFLWRSKWKLNSKEIPTTQIGSAQKNNIMQEVQDGHYRLIYSTNERHFLTCHESSHEPFWHWKKLINFLFAIFQVIVFCAYMHSRN